MLQLLGFEEDLLPAVPRSIGRPQGDSFFPTILIHVVWNNQLMENSRVHVWDKKKDSVKACTFSFMVKGHWCSQTVNLSYDSNPSDGRKGSLQNGERQ